MKSGGIIISALLLVGAGLLFGLSISNFQKNNADLPSVVQKKNTALLASIENLAEIEKATISLFENSVPSVAYITTTNLEQSYWNRDVTEIPRGSGSGFVWDAEGHIVTNYHVIQGADRATVTLYDQTTYQAILVGAAPDTDLAVLKIDVDSGPLQPITKGFSADLKVGQSVFAIGNPFGLDYTLTTGIISALDREINSMSDVKITGAIQTDAAINPGNSGGPLLNSSGELIGVNTSIISPSGAYAGIGFSIPIDVVTLVIPDLIQYGHIKRPVLGIVLLQGRVAQERYGLEGALIMKIVPGKGADLAGLQGTGRDRFGRIILGDLITGVDGKPIANNSDLVLALKEYSPGDKVEVDYLRNNEKNSVDIVLSEN